ncbi:peptidoglycan DD-metalloendopeptidase family protein [Nesterenkonia rhizosphaerae]|uniref:Tape measure domain-containing protein n=1 Tax=Nesterenkonia rhizosphaerae TaxID=1348272 RepID=A0ABP9G2T1_9MICC
MAVVGAAEVPVRPTFPGFQREVGREVAGVGQNFEKQGPGLGRRLMSGIGTGLKYGALAVGTATAGILTTALVRGWQRLSAIENAEAKLRGLGHSAQSVDSIMSNALDSVRGTAFGLDEAATVAASTVAAGIKPGKDLEEVLRLTADAATIAGVGMDEMGAIFNKVASSNKIQGDVIAQLHGQGIPVIQMLADELGTSVEKTYELASAGEINFETFRSAMENGLGGAALSAGDTTTGAFANMMAALSRFGAQLLTGVYPLARHVFGGLTEWIDNLTEVAAPAVTSISEGMVTGLQALAGAWNNSSQEAESSGFVGFLERLGSTARRVFDATVNWINQFREGWKNTADDVERTGIAGFFERFSLAAGSAGDTADNAGGIFESLGGILTGLGSVLPGLISSGLSVLANVIGWIGDNMHLVLPLIPVLLTGFAAWKVASMGLTAATTRLQAAQVAMAPLMLASNVARLTAVRMEARLAAAQSTTTATTTAQTTALQRKTTATTVATGAQRGLNAAMRANPIGAIITAVTLLVGALAWFFTQTETGQKIWETVWNGIKSVVSGVVDWFQNTVVPIFAATWNAITAAATWAYENVIRPVINAFAAIFKWLYETVIEPVAGFITAAFRFIGSVISAVWTGFLQPTIQLIGDIFRWLWENVARPAFARIGQAFRDMGSAIARIWNGVLKPTIDLLGAIVRWLWENVARPYFERIWQRFQSMGRWISDVWSRVLQPLFVALGDLVMMVWSDWIRPAFDRIGEAWENMTGWLDRTWKNTLRPIFEAVGDFVREQLVSRIENGIDLIKSAWETLKAGFATPINWVINTVWNNGIKAAFDSVAKAVGSDARMGEIPTIDIPAFAKGGYHGGGWALVGEEGPELVNFDRPGRVYTAAETRSALGMGETPIEKAVHAGTLAPTDAPIGGGWLRRGANWLLENTPAGAVVEWSRGKLADGAETLFKPILDKVSGFVSQFGMMGQLGSGFIDYGVEKVLDWIRGQDDDAAAEGVYDGRFAANPGGFNRPAAGPVTSRFGPRNIPGGFSNFHAGIDIGAPQGATVRAAWDGVVKRTGWGPGNLGNLIVLNHGGFDSAYAHLSRIGVKAGQEVTGGQAIGAVGATGGRFASHLHFEQHRPGFYNPVNVNHLFRDNGGLLPPGRNIVDNWTGGTEYIFNQAQFNAVRDAVLSGGPGRGDHLTVNQYAIESKDAHRNAQRMRSEFRKHNRRKLQGVR